VQATVIRHPGETYGAQRLHADLLYRDVVVLYTLVRARLRLTDAIVINQVDGAAFVSARIRCRRRRGSIILRATTRNLDMLTAVLTGVIMRILIGAPLGLATSLLLLRMLFRRGDCLDIVLICKDNVVAGCYFAFSLLL
jgi:hypothetical protein